MLDLAVMMLQKAGAIPKRELNGSAFPDVIGIAPVLSGWTGTLQD